MMLSSGRVAMLRLVMALIFLRNLEVAFLEGYTYSPIQSVSCPAMLEFARIIQKMREGLISWNVHDIKSSLEPILQVFRVVFVSESSRPLSLRWFSMPVWIRSIASRLFEPATTSSAKRTIQPVTVVLSRPPNFVMISDLVRSGCFWAISAMASSGMKDFFGFLREGEVTTELSMMTC